MSFTFSSVIYLVSKQEDHHKLTDQQQALSHGQNPLPIYLVLNVKDKISNRDFRGNNYVLEIYFSLNLTGFSLGLELVNLMQESFLNQFTQKWAYISY